MKKLIILLFTFLAALTLPTFAYADVAVPGVVSTIRYLPCILVAVVIIVIAILIAAIRKRRPK